MKLSIITINLNNAGGLRKTLDSVAAQTFGDYEHIIIDGSSTDSSVEVIEEYACEASEGQRMVIWVSEPDKGIYNAMNKGIKKASGEYLLFLNSGDYLVGKDVLQEVFQCDCHADILCAGCNVLKDVKIVWTSNPPAHVTFGTLYNVGLNHQSTFIKKDLFDQVGLYREDFKYNSDIDFWYRAIILDNASTQKIDVITTNYCLGGLSDQHKNDDIFIREHREILSNPIFTKITPDYEQWKLDRAIKDRYGWLDDYLLLSKILSWVHKCIKKFPKQ